MDYIVWTVISVIVVLSVLGLIYSGLVLSSQVVSLDVHGYSLGNVLIVEVSNIGTTSVRVEKIYLSNCTATLTSCRLVNRSVSTILRPGSSVIFLFRGEPCRSVRKIVVVTDKGVFSCLVS